MYTGTHHIAKSDVEYCDLLRSGSHEYGGPGRSGVRQRLLRDA